MRKGWHLAAMIRLLRHSQTKGVETVRPRLKSPDACSLLYPELERGKTHNIAVRALAFKWLRILHRCWMDRKPYDEAT